MNMLRDLKALLIGIPALTLLFAVIMGSLIALIKYTDEVLIVFALSVSLGIAYAIGRGVMETYNV